MKRLIVNADDYGRTPEISRGIREAHLHGVVTSTTCMMNIPTTEEDIAVALKETPRLGMGVHLVLTMGDPISAPETIPSIVDEEGHFFKYRPLLEQLLNIKVDDVKREWRAQIEAFLQVADRKPTHLDSHHHSSYFSPALFRAMLELAKEYDCAIRFPFVGDVSKELEETNKRMPDLIREFDPPHPDRFLVDFYDERASLEELSNMIKDLPDETTEIMCHPGYTDAAFAAESVYNNQRDRELEILTHPSIKEAIQANDIQLISFASL